MNPQFDTTLDAFWFNFLNKDRLIEMRREEEARHDRKTQN